MPTLGNEVQLTIERLGFFFRENDKQKQKENHKKNGDCLGMESRNRELAFALR